MKIFLPDGTELTRHMLNLANFPSGSKLLDVCCGAGAAVKILLEAGFDAWGIDLEPPTDAPRLARGTAYELPCEEASLDGILCECGFSLLEPAKALREFARVLKPGAALLFSDLYARAEGGQFGKVSIHTQEELKTLLNQHDFELQFFEDCTGVFKSFLAQQIMERGCGWLCEELGADLTAIRPIKCGYCFFMARKGN